MIKNAKLYINGKEEAKAAFGKNLTTNAAPIRIRDGMDGLVDEVQLLSSALTLAEINQVMKEGIQLAVQSSSKATTSWGRVKIANNGRVSTK